jgi:hypothetical protein
MTGMRLVRENLPASLQSQRDILARCLEAMDGFKKLKPRA